jgi:hypothetical protein
LRVLFFMQNTRFVRHFDAVLKAMVSRGDRLHLAFDSLAPAGESFTARLLEDHPEIEVETVPGPRDVDRWRILSDDLRRALHYFHYLQPWFAGSPALRGRIPPPPKTVRLLAEHGVGSGRRLAAVTWLLRRMADVCPPRAEIEEFIAARNPDLVLVTPLVQADSAQPDYVRAARRLGKRTMACVASWDNLTTKGRLQPVPDFVTVWNDHQRREAVEMHGVSEERILVTGAQSFDHWFGWRPSTSRQEFCDQVGLCATRPFVLYMGSSDFVAGHQARDELSFVREWARALRASDGLEELQVMFRPYPGATNWPSQGELAAALEEVPVWPLESGKPGDLPERSRLFDSIYHSAAVVGINSSALIESAIIGRPVLTLLSPEFRHAQEETLHFRLIDGRDRGFVKVAQSPAEHHAQIAEVLRGPNGSDAAMRRGFLEHFVRPHGLDTPAAGKLLEAFDFACSRPPPDPPRRSASGALLRACVGPVASAARRRRIRHWREAKRQRLMGEHSH